MDSKLKKLLKMIIWQNLPGVSCCDTAAATHMAATQSTGSWLSSWLEPMLNWLRGCACNPLAAPFWRPLHPRGITGCRGCVRSLFFKQEMELTLVGLQNSGKTTLVNVVAVRQPGHSMASAHGPCPSAPRAPGGRRAASRRT